MGNLEEGIIIEYEIGKPFDQDLNGIDLVYSQSVFEHVKYDLSGFKILFDKFKKAKQIHFVPAAISFLNYQKHGYRRYTYNSLIKLKKILNYQMNFCGIGSTRTLRYHFNFLEKNNDNDMLLTKFLKYKDNFKIEKELTDFLITDASKNFPVFYAIEF